MKELITINTLVQRIQEIETDMLSYLLNICREQDVNVYLWGGSLLGAVRHHGFIPWDDDLDIVMERKDFQKLKNAILSNPDERYELILPEAGKEFTVFIPMLTYRNSYLGSYGPLKNEYTRIHLDIFLLDRTADQKWKRKMHGLLLRVCYGLALGHRSSKDFSKRYEYSFVEIVSAKLLAFIGKLIPYRMIMKLQATIAQHYAMRKTKYMMCTNNAPTCLSEKHCHPADVYRKTEWVPFGLIEAPIMYGYDTLLKKGYGNYMELPPEEKRKPAHIIGEKIIIDGQQWTDMEDEGGKKQTNTGDFC